MSIVSISSLSTSDLNRLGNNLRPSIGRKQSPRRRRRQRLVAAVNRSLATLGERIAGLHTPVLVTA